MVEVIAQSAGNSRMFADRARHIVENDYRPRSMVDIWPRDLGIVSVPLVAVALRRYRAAQDAGDGKLDNAAIARVYARAAGVKLPGEV